MTKLFRVVAYVLDLNHSSSKEDVVIELEGNRYPEFLSVKDVQEADIGKWNDDHKLNNVNATVADYDKYFPDMNVDSEEKYEVLKRHFRATRSELINERQKVGELEYEISELQKELKSFEKIQEFLKNLDGLRK